MKRFLLLLTPPPVLLFALSLQSFGDFAPVTYGFATPQEIEDNFDVPAGSGVEFSFDASGDGGLTGSTDSL
jgi:hypothetical protein